MSLPPVGTMEGSVVQLGVQWSSQQVLQVLMTVCPAPDR